MRHKLPVIFASFSFVILGVLIAAGLVSKRPGTARASRLFAQAAPAEEAELAAEQTDANKELVSDVYRETDEPTSAEAEETTSEEDDASAEPEDAATDHDDETREPLEKYRDLLTINPYVSGWLSIDGTPLDAPVVYTPKSQNYFLHRAIDGSEEERGSLFIADLWRPEYNNTLIYGHNMKDGSGFGSLMKYADEAYGSSHSLLRFDTLYDEQEYELFAVFYSQIDEEELETDEDRKEADKQVEEDSLANMDDGTSPEELTLADLDLYEDFGDIDIYREEKDSDNERFRYYYYTDLSDRDDFDYFVEHVKERALYDTGVDVEWGDDLLTLSTCSYHVKNGRLVVVARKLR